MKMQRVSALMTEKLSVITLIRVVPPKYSVPCGADILAVFCMERKEEKWQRKN